MRLGMWTVVSLNVGAFFSQGDEGVQVMLYLDEFVDPVLQPGQTRTVLVSRLERLVRGAAQNDTLKLLLLRSPGFVERLLELLEAPQDARGSRFGVSATVRNHAAKVIEHIVASPEAQIEFVDRRFHLRILSLMEDAHTAFYVKKTLATALVALGSQQANLPELSQAGLVSTLHREQELEGLRRERVQIALHKMSYLLEQTLSPSELEALSDEERLVVRRYSAEDCARRSSPFYSIRNSVIEQGLLFYLHTAAGGAAWGLFESVRQRQGRSALMQNVARTSLVTCFVPILLVGGVVSTYTRANRTTDTITEKFQLFFASSMALYPAHKLLQWVERFAPLWLGGHIVGFVSFFCWTLYTESDLLKSDHKLLAAAAEEDRRLAAAEEKAHRKSLAQAKRE